MASDNSSKIESEIWKEIAGKNLSPSHDRWHIDRVMKFAFQLQSIYGGDPEVLTAAVIMHDMGRSDPTKRGEVSIGGSVEQAQLVLDNLESIDFPEEKQKKVLLAIKEHDKPKLNPNTIEGRILKEADFLAGFGPWGILRIAMWAAETGGGVSQIHDRLENRMQKRLESLEFPESKRWAIRETMFVKLFLSLLRDEPILSTPPPKGNYIVLEGISGSGKNTQATLLREELEKRGHTIKIVAEPAEAYRTYRDAWENKNERQLDDPVIMRFLLLADRYQLIKEEVQPFLNDGGIVISVRNFISTLVYQSKDDVDLDEITFIHRFVPTPDILILYDLEAETSYKRLKDRKKRGLFESLDQLKLHRKRYRDICQNPLVRHRMSVIDASKTIQEITTQSLEVILTVLSQNGNKD